jgi:HAD superfamily hydrolase (TIGR01509 family)
MHKIWTGIEAFIFDMDGVLVDTEPLHVEAERMTCQHFGIVCPLTEWNNFKGQTAISIANYILTNYGAESGITAEDFVNQKTASFLELARTKMTPIAGSREFILKVRSIFPKLALTTSSKQVIQRLVFERLVLNGLFDVIVTAEEVKQGKPNPEPYLITLKKLGLTGEQCVVIEDSNNGIISARLAGCRTIGITTSCDEQVLEKAEASLIVQDFAGLTKLLE